MAAPRRTRRLNKKGRVLNVKSAKDVHLFEKAIVKGPLTLVYVNAKWCGACHKFSEEVWSPLTKLKNKNINIASIDSEMIGKTSLANVPRKFYPTLMLVGKDKKPATFKDETGAPTNAMPRGNSLMEDKSMLTTLVQTKQPTAAQLESVKTVESSIPTEIIDAQEANFMKEGEDDDMEVMSLKPHANSMPREQLSPNVAINTVGKSPFEATIKTARNTPRLDFKPKSVSGSAINMTTRPPNVAADVGASLVASQTKSPTATAGIIAKQEGGRLLRAIRNQTASLKAFLRKQKRSRKHRS